MRKIIIIAMLGFFGLTAKAQTEKTTSDLNKEVIELIKIQSGDVVTSLLKPALERVSGKKRKQQVLNRINVIKDNFYFGFYPIYGLIRNIILLIIPRNLSSALKGYLKG
jgi:hypothetical protein